MHLMPSDSEKLLLAVAGMLARDRQARGVRLNHPESVALLSCWVIERAREGSSVSELMEAGRRVLTADDVMEGVAAMTSEVQVEATFPDGRKLVTLHWPIQPVSGTAPGALEAAAGEIEINRRSDAGRTTLVFTNVGDRPIQVGSHFHLPDVNIALEFDRERAQGCRLDVPSGTSVRFEPGISKELAVITLGGTRTVPGLSLASSAADTHGRERS